jgi:hypothetical protein
MLHIVKKIQEQPRLLRSNRGFMTSWSTYSASLVAISSQNAMAARSSFGRGILMYVRYHFEQMKFTAHLKCVVMILRHLFLLRPEELHGFLESDLAGLLIENSNDRVFEVKSHILRLFCYLTRDLDRYIDFFIESDLIEAYVDGLECDPSAERRRGLIESLINLLQHAKRTGDGKTLERLLDIYGDADLLGVLDRLRDEAEDDHIRLFIEELHEWMHMEADVLSVR